MYVGDLIVYTCNRRTPRASLLYVLAAASFYVLVSMRARQCH